MHNEKFLDMSRNTLSHVKQILCYSLMKSLTILTVLLLFLGVSTYAGDTFEWPVKELDTARELLWMSDVEKDVILEINKFRFSPSQYSAQYIEPVRPFFSGKIQVLANGSSISTDKLNDLVAELASMHKMPILTPSRGMTKSARLLVYDQELTGKVGHISSGNRNTKYRLQLFGKWYGISGEAILYGDVSTGRSIVINMLLDAGTRDIDCQECLFNPAFQNVGISVGPHKTYSTMCVVTFCSKYVEK